MNKFITKWIATCLALALFATQPTVSLAQAQPSDLCQAKGIAFLFFNGVQTTPDQAETALAEFRRLHGTTTPAGEAIRYEKIYNYTNGFEDFVETFEQRLNEQQSILGGRFYLFFESFSGRSTWWESITNTVSAYASLLSAIGDLIRAQQIRDLTALLASPPTELVYAEHRSRIENTILEGKKLLLVAHSQGNLFVNAAYTFALTKTTAASAKVVHIAPASPILRGSHTLADLDLVINGLRATGTVPPVTDTIPGYLLRPAGVNGRTDLLGHGLIEIYLNRTMDPATRIRAHINDAFTTLVAPTSAASQGFFTATLTWNGTGDVDLHTYEPGGAHVFYRNPVGVSGKLDVDNTVANGPEHYYATCNAAALQPGTYRIAVANYFGADGRTATVQIASASDGVLGTKSVTLGAATGNTPGGTLFSIVVSKDSQSGKFSVGLGP